MVSPPCISVFTTLGSLLDSKQSRESVKFQLVSSVVSLAQFVSSSVALLAELVSRKRKCWLKINVGPATF